MQLAKAACGRLYSCGIALESGRTPLIEEPSVRPVLKPLDLGLLRDLQRVIYLDPEVVKMCSYTFALLDTESCYVQYRLQAFDCKGHQLEILNIILGAPVEAHD